jgi:phenylalanyl-tRNA synthetase beta chain
MLYSTRWLQNYLSTKLPTPEKLADLLSMHAFEVEGVQKKGKDSILDIDVLPNRAHDCLNHVGMAREIAALKGKKVKLPKTKKALVKKGSLRPLRVQIESSELVPRYTAFVIEGIKLGKSPKQVQEYLRAVGVNSINNIVDLTNFVMLEMGQPLHAFDYDQIKGSRMNVRPAKAGEKLETLDEQELKLPKGAMVIEDAERLIDLAGIKGGKNSGISKNTKNIVLQAANFAAAPIYRTKNELKYTTQAADMYAHELDPNATMPALERANQLLQEWGIDGTIAQVIDIYPRKVATKRISLDLAHVDSLLGVSIPRVQAKQILQSLDCKVTEKGSVLQVEVPARRIDLAIPEDLVEEIGRIYGYENIPSTFPVASLIPPRRNNKRVWEELTRDTLQQLGFTEIYNYSFIAKNDPEIFQYSTEQLVELENPISDEFFYMRPSLLENLLKNVRDNQKLHDDIRIFELGKIFPDKTQETSMLGGFILAQGYYEAKGVIDFLMQSLGIANVWYDTYEATSDKSSSSLWHKGKSAEVKVGSKEVGFVGEISGRITSQLKIQKGIGAFHLNMEKLLALANENKEHRPASKFPSVIRDIAILAPSQTKVVDLMNAMKAKGQSIIQDIDLFDMYEGGNTLQGQKSFAFHIVYQANDRTLTNKEVDILHNNIITSLEGNSSWEVRK